jgi:hypothetical protein
MTVLVAIFITVAGRFMADEVKAWINWLHKWLRNRAVAGLPERCRERYNEEWKSGLEETPGDIFKLIYSVGLLKASARIHSDELKNIGSIKKSSAPLTRLFDVAFSIFAIPIFLPPLLLLAIAIKLDSNGPVFYFSERIGKNGRIFRIIKLRTMVHDAHNRNVGIVQLNDRDGLHSKIFDVPRITLVGGFLRRWAFDELPQLYNVLRGDMSIVGPRQQF